MREQLSWLRRVFGAGLMGFALLGLAPSGEADAKPAAPVDTPCVDGEPGCDAAPLNIICNDGTESPTCEVCRRGCCSHHGGCR